MLSVAKKMKYKRRQFGFTLLEATMAMVLLAIASAGILLPFANAASVQAEGANQTMAANLASELMEKIQATNYANIILTYNGYSESAGALKDAAGQTHTSSAYTGFSRTAVCQTANVYGVNLIAVTVKVFHDGREMTQVTTLIGDHE